MSQQVETGNKAFTAGGALGLFTRVKLSAGVLAAAGASDVSIGVLQAETFASGDIAAVRLRTAQGTMKMVANNAITAGNPVYAAASGKVAPSGTVYEGIALEAATADGDIIEVLPLPNVDVSATITGTNAASFTVDADLVDPKLAISGDAAGSGDFTITLKPEATLDANATVRVPEADGDTLAAVALAQTLTNKTLTAPVITALPPTMRVATVVVGGTAIGNANAVTSGFTLVTGANDTAAVKLPEAAAEVVVVIKNLVANKILPVFPAVNDKINNAAANAVYNIPNGGQRMFIAYNATDWFSHPETIA